MIVGTTMSVDKMFVVVSLEMEMVTGMSKVARVG